MFKVMLLCGPADGKILELRDPTAPYVFREIDTQKVFAEDGTMFYGPKIVYRPKHLCLEKAWLYILVATEATQDEITTSVVKHLLSDKAREVVA